LAPHQVWHNGRESKELCCNLEGMKHIEPF
jgi:hypothetical protein